MSALLIFAFVGVQIALALFEPVVLLYFALLTSLVSSSQALGVSR